MIKEEALRRPEIKELFKVCATEDSFRDMIMCFFLSVNKHSTDVVMFFFRSKTCPKPKLALNGVGGKSATELLRHLR